MKKQALDLEARLRLFVKIAGAVHHAHQKGVIHRDIKPSNILITEENGRPRAKVIDFGIAKAVDVRSDVHALGALLSEMLTDAPVVDQESMKGKSLHVALLEIARRDLTPSRQRPLWPGDAQTFDTYLDSLIQTQFPEAIREARRFQSGLMTE